MVRKTKFLIRIGLLVICTVISLFLDIKYAFTFSFLYLENLFTVLFTAITVFSGIWITCYLLLLQLYKDRYPLQRMSQVHLPKMKEAFCMIIGSIILGCSITLFGLGDIFILFFCAISLFTILEILILAYHSNKSLMLSTHVDDFCEEIKENFNKNICHDNDNIFTAIKHILDESIVKEEYYIAQNIIEKTGEIFRSFLENSIKLNNSTSSEDIKKTFNEIVEINIYSLTLCDNIKTSLLIEKIIGQQRKNLNFCIQNSQDSWFKEYFEKFNAFLFNAQRKGNVTYLSEMYTIYSYSVKKLAENKHEDMVIYVLKEIELRIPNILFNDENISLSEYIGFLVKVTVLCVEEGYNGISKLLSKKFKKVLANNYLPLETFDKVKPFIAVLFTTLVKKDFNQALDYYDLLFYGINLTEKTDSFLEFKSLCLKIFFGDVKNSDHHEKLYELRISLTREIISQNSFICPIMNLPNFTDEMKKRNYEESEIKRIVTDIRSLLQYSISKKNNHAFYKLTDRLNTMIIDTDNECTQIELIKIYFSASTYSLHLESKDCFEIAFMRLEKALNKLDEKHKITESFAEEIISQFKILICSLESNDTYILDTVFSLFSSLNDLNFVLSFPLTKEMLYRKTFNIGVSCIENDNEKCLKEISNTLGWYIIKGIENASEKTTTYLIERACELFSIAQKMDVSIKTQVFLITLFTTIGPYCCKDSSYKRYLNIVLKALIGTDNEKIEIAIKLRTSENDMFDATFDGRTKELTDEFLKELEKFKESQTARDISYALP